METATVSPPKLHSFTTLFGRTIPFIKGYYEAHKNKHIRHYISPNDTERLKERLKEPMSYNAFRKDLVEYVLMMDFLRSIGLTGPWGRILDVGGEEAAVARFFKGFGKAKCAESIDIAPYYEKLSSRLFRRFYRDIFYPHLGPVRIPRKLAGLFHPRYYNWAGQTALRLGYVPGRYFGWDIALHRTPEVDNYHVGDFMTYPFTGQYDFISALLCITYFDPEKLFERVSSLLHPGGIFVFLVDYFWFPVNSIDFAGHFPYVCQRLTKEDFNRYVQEHFPSERAVIMQNYESFHHGKPQTLHSYAETASKYGLSVMGEKRLMPFTTITPRTPLPPPVLDHYANSALSDVLEDIHQFRSDVQLIDLKTSFVLMAFQKTTERKPDLYESIRAIPRIPKYEMYHY